MMIPVGPYMLSIHPFKGSLYVGMTIAGRKTAIGSPFDCALTRSSANAFVYVYVFGQSWRSLMG
jgi:hypothetical protein